PQRASGRGGGASRATSEGGARRRGRRAAPAPRGGGVGLRRAARSGRAADARRAARLRRRRARELQASRRPHAPRRRAPHADVQGRQARAAHAHGGGAIADGLTLSLVIPFYNQRARARQTASEAARFLRERFAEQAELIVVDDGSSPGQAVEAGDVPPGVTLIRQPQNLGKGGAVRSGVARARGEFIVFTDSDLPFSLDPLPTTLAWLRDGADIVVGDRRQPLRLVHNEETSVRLSRHAPRMFLDTLRIAWRARRGRYG